MLGKVLSEVGDAELIAASNIFKNLDSFADRGKALNRALGHLESAHQLFKGFVLSCNRNFNGFSTTLNIGQLRIFAVVVWVKFLINTTYL